MANKALLVGINKYPMAPLAGCVNDVTDVAQYLVKKQGFKQEEIRLLVDGRATTKEITNRLNWLVLAKPGDRVLFHYSGHGTQVATRNPQEEVDGLDEVICPVDFDWSESHLLRDKQLHTIFSKLPPGVKFYWISDSCHSGQLSDSARDVVQTRSLDRARNYPIPEDVAWRNNIAITKNLKLNKIVNPTLDVGYISGCMSNQTSADAVFNGRPNGAATYFLLKALQTNPTAPLTELIKIITTDLETHHYAQKPQAEGLRANLPFLG